VKAEIDMQLKEKANIEKTLPQSIVIGPFYVNCDTIRQALSKKRKELANALLEYVVNRLRNKAERVSYVYNIVCELVVCCISLNNATIKTKYHTISFSTLFYKYSTNGIQLMTTEKCFVILSNFWKVFC